MNILFYLHFVITSDSFVNFDFFYGVKFKNILSKRIFEKWQNFDGKKLPENPKMKNGKYNETFCYKIDT